MSASTPTSFVRTRWWWVRHAPVRSDGGRIYGGQDIACDCGDAHVFSGLAPLLPRGAVWVASHLGRTRQTAEALWQAGDRARAESRAAGRPRLRDRELLAHPPRPLCRP